MAEQRTPTIADASPRRSTGGTFWWYLVFWLLSFGLLLFISFFGAVAEA